MCAMWIEDGILTPLSRVRNMRLWEEYFMKFVHNKERMAFSHWPMEVLEVLMMCSKETNLHILKQG